MGGLWFEVLSDVWPHGAVAARYGVLRALLVSDINRRPDLQWLADALEKINRP